MLLIVDIRKPLEEQQREDLGLEVRRIHRPFQVPRGLPEGGRELGEGDGHLMVR